MGYVWDFSILGKYSHLFWTGIAYTLVYTVGTIGLGTLTGIFVAVLRIKKLRLLDWPLIAYLEIFRCTPLLVQIIWFYYAFPVVIGLNITPHVAAMTVLSLYAGAFYSEVFRGSIESIERGQWEAGRALGLRNGTILRLVIFPQAFKRMLAPFVNQSIMNLKNTSLVSTIAVPDILYQATLVNSETYRPLEVYTLVAFIYFAILFPATLYAQGLEKRLANDRR
jgi:polar amino acid transport system permease protein